MSELQQPPTDDDLDGDGEVDDPTRQQRDPNVVGRIVEPDEGAATDEEATTVASETDDTAGLSAEEAAMHVTEEPG
jgi:hypothetical protein